VAAPVQAPAGQTTNAAAMQALQRGQYFSNRYNNRHQPIDLQQAQTAFDEALKLDPAMANAAAEAAFLRVFRIEAGADPSEMAREIEQWGLKAVTLNPGNGLGWAARAAAEAFQKVPDVAKIRTYSLRGATLAPRTSLAQVTPGLAGRIGIALTTDVFLETHRLDPLYQAGAANLAWALLAGGHADKALQYLETADAIEPAGIAILGTRPLVLADLRRTGEAVEALARLRDAFSAGQIGEAQFLWTELPVLLEQGDKRSADAALVKGLGFASDPGTSPILFADNIVQVAPFLARHGRVDDALRLMQECVARGAPPAYDWLVLDARLAPLRKDARFAAILARSRAKFVVLLKDLDAAKSRGELPAYLHQPLAELRQKLGM
jgi:tetratricopeptide (TPR) repeat protein